MTAAEFVNPLQGVRRTSHGFEARCPAHEDNRASLSVADGEKGIVLKCHAGCSVEQICASMGIVVSDLFNGNRKPEIDIVATYDYTDEAGKVLFQVVRFDPKDFRQRKPDPKALDGWIWNTQDACKVPFHLPQLLTAVKSSHHVFITEGEKDVLAVEKAGFAATCNAGGAGKWLRDYNKHLAGAEVIVIADKDSPGRKHAQDVAAKLQGTAAIIKLLELPDLDGHPVKDAADYFAAGGRASDLAALAEEAPQWKPEAATDPWLVLVEDGADLQARKLPAVIEIVAGMVCAQSKLVIGSGSKSYKTWLSMDMALSIAHGIPVLEHATTRRRVLYVNLELKPETFARRGQAIA